MLRSRRVPLVFLFLLLSAGISQAQQRFTAYPVVVADLFSGVESIYNHIPSSGTVANIQSNTVEVGEATHACRIGGANTGSHSVWFALAFAGGTLVIDTNGSDYNTVMSVYGAAGLFSALTPVACNDDQSGANNTARVSAALPAGIYYVQISRHETAAGGGPYTLQLAISAALDGTPPANDNFANAQTIRFNEKLTINNVQYATEEATEPNSSCSSARPSHSIWFKVNAPASHSAVAFSASTEGSKLDYGNTESPDTVITIFEGASLATLNEVDCNDDTILNSASVTSQFFPPMVTTLYIRVSAYNPRNLVGPSSFRLKVTVQTFIYLHADPDFENIPLNQWTFSNPTGDEQVCNQPDTTFNGVCSVRFTGSPSEESSLKQNVSVPPQMVMKKKQTFVFGFALSAPDPATNFKGQFKVKYTDGTPATKIPLRIVGSLAPSFAPYIGTAAIASKNVGNMSIKFKNKSTAGTIYLDTTLTAVEGNLGRDLQTALPVPPAP